MKNCVIVSAARTAIGSFNGALATTSAVELGATVIKAALERAHLDPQQVDEVIMGNVLQAGLGQNPARQALLKSGLSDTVCGFTINKVCGSGLKSVALAAQAIQAGQAQAIVAGGMENMSQAPYLLDAKARWGYRLGDGQLSDVILRDGLICAEQGYHMGITAENVAREYGINREMQDELALTSQHKAVSAIESGAFQTEIVPVSVVSRKKTIVFDRDEFPKADTTAEGLAALRPAFDKNRKRHRRKCFGDQRWRCGTGYHGRIGSGGSRTETAGAYQGLCQRWRRTCNDGHGSGSGDAKSAATERASIV